MKLLIGIPAYNEEDAIEKIVKSIPARIGLIRQIDVLVVDDGSNDDTFIKAKRGGAKVLRHILNRGLGGALKTIFTFAKMRKYDILVTMDADGQHKPSDIDRIIQPLTKDGFNVVIGSRWKNYNANIFTRFILNQIANAVTLLLFGVWSSDTQSGYRAFDKNAIEKIKIVSDGMEVSSEFFKEILRNKLAFTEVSIEAIYTEYSRGKGQKMHNSPEVLFQLLMRLIK